MNTGSGKSKFQVMDQINVVPLIDVALVLLLIFMIITPILVRSQIKINIPTSKSADKADPNEKKTEVKVQKDGSIFIDGGHILEQEIGEVLKRRAADPEKHAVIIEADRNVSFQHVVTVMGAAKKLGINRIAIKVQEEKKTGSGG